MTSLIPEFHDHQVGTEQAEVGVSVARSYLGEMSEETANEWN